MTRTSEGPRLRFGRSGTIALLAALLAVGVLRGGAARTLDLYFIDVEGGQSTLIVTPAEESLLVDTGYNGFDGRDSKRILAAARDAGVTRIDYLLMTHFHPDHEGGVVALANELPIGTYFDHGDLARSPTALADPRWPATAASYAAYAAARAKGKHVEPKPGERLPLKGIEAIWVASAEATIKSPVAGAGQPNAACPATSPAAAEPLENPRSTGFHLRYGKFRFVDLGDLSGAPLFALVCPRNLLGPIDLYLVPHHGGGDSSYPATFAAVQPRVGLVNNGAIKGGSTEVFDAIRGIPGAEGWQLHRSQLPDVRNLPDDRIANLDDTTGYWIKASASEDGSFTVTNARTGATVSYKAR